MSELEEDENTASLTTSAANYGSTNETEFDVVFVVSSSLKKKDGSPFYSKIEKPLKAAGLDVVVLDVGESSENKFICCTATEDRLKKEAVRISFQLPLVSAIVMETAKAKIVPNINEDPQYCNMTPYEHLYAPYCPDEESQGLYSRLGVPGDDGEPMLFSSKQRAELIMSIVKGPKPEGARIQLGKLLQVGKITAAFQVHEQKALANLLQDVTSSCMFCTCGVPVEAIRNYFGEKIAFYVAFVTCYTNYLLLPLGLLGVACYIGSIILYDDTGETTGERIAGNILESNVVMAALIIIFATTFTEVWRRAQAINAKKWGTTDSQEDQPDRPEFNAKKKPIISFVDGSYMKYDPPWTRFFRFTVSTAVTVFMAAISIAGVAVIFYLRWYVTIKRGVAYDGIEVGTYIAAVASAVQVQIMALIWEKISKRLNNYENHRTDTDYESNWIFKKYIFSFINSYASLFYIGFIETAVGDPCSNYGYDSCIDLLGVQLAILVVSQMLASIGTTALKQCCHKIPEDKSPIEVEFELEEYDYLTGLNDDYGEMVIQYGYCVLFGSSFPPVFILAYLNNWIDTQFYSQKICTQTRRPIAQKAESIGLWFPILQQLVNVAVITNSALVIFDSILLVHHDERFKLIAFLIAPYALFCIKSCIDFLIDDVPYQVRVQLKRERFIVKRLVLHEEGNVSDSSDEDEPL